MPNLSLVISNDPAEYDFFQLLRLLELKAKRDPEMLFESIGLDSAFSKEFVEFRVMQTLSFSGSAAPRAELVQYDGQHRVRLDLTCFGLTGATGVLPAFYTDLLKRRIRQKDTALNDLLDILNARAIAFLYRAWQKNRMPITFERRLCLDRQDERDHATEIIASYTGVGSPVRKQAATEQLDSLPLYFSGFYSKRPRNASALSNIASALLGVSVEILQFFGRWFDLDPEQQNSLGQANMGLGASFVSGGSVFDGNHSLRIRTEPVGFEKFNAFHPNKPLFKQLQRAVKLYLGDEYVVDLQVVLKREEVPALDLCEPEEGGEPLGLGYGMWVISSERSSDADEAVFKLIA